MSSPTLRMDAARFERVASGCRWSGRSLAVVRALLVDGKPLSEVAALFDMKAQNANTLRARFLEKVEKDRLESFIQRVPASFVIALRPYAAEIRKLQALKYSDEQIHGFLSENGVTLPLSTLQSYLEDRPGMKTIVLANQKGGVGKSATAVQLAYFIRLLLGKRVVVVDLDHQRNTSKALKTGGIATVSATPASHLLTNKITSLAESDFVLIGADNGPLLKMEKQADKHNHFATNLQSFLQAIDEQFDVCIIDTNPNPDIRQLSALVVSDFVLSPIQLNQEAIDGIGDLLNHETIGIRKIQATINPKLKLIGILPNLVEPTPFQRDNFRDLAVHFAKLLIALPQGGHAAIRKTTAIPEAQAIGVPVWKLGKTSGRDAWAQMKPVFETITETMGVK